MPSTISIHGPELGRSEECEAILRALPEWFGIESALVQYVRQVAELPTFVARDGGVAVGFIAVKRHSPHAAEMYVLGVLPDRHRQGIGRALTRRVEAWLAGEGIEYLQVKTVGPSRDCASYAETRAFYEAMGFRALEEIATLWDERNPCLIMVKAVSGQR